MTRKDSNFIYGVAILLMLYHHLYVWGADDHIAVLNAIFGGNTEQRFAWLCRLCVSLFSFVSGYGLCRIVSIHPVEERIGIHALVSGYRLAIRQIMKLMKRYWLVFLIFVPMGVLLGKQPIGSWRTLLLSLLGLDVTYNDHWWYVLQYMMMVMLFPLLDLVVCRTTLTLDRTIVRRFQKGRQSLIICGFLFLLIFALLRNHWPFLLFVRLLGEGRFVFTLVFVVGYLCSFLKLFEGKTASMKWMQLAGILLMAVCLAVRFLRADTATYTKYDAFITAPIVYGLLCIKRSLPDEGRIVRAIGFCGSHATYMWLAHGFFCARYFRSFILLPRLSGLIWIWLVAVSLVVSLGLEQLEKAFEHSFRRIHKEKRG